MKHQLKIDSYLDSYFIAPADNSQFEVVGGILQFKTAPDFENPTDLGGTPGDNIYEVSVLADDGNGGLTPQTILVTVTDGDYTLRTLDAISDSAGNVLDGDNDGNAGGDATDNFFRLFGDINGDRSVNMVDFFQFRNAFAGRLYNAAFDFNGDGVINILDFFRFRSRFGTSL